MHLFTASQIFSCVFIMSWIVEPKRGWSPNLPGNVWMWPYLEIIFEDDQVKMRPLG